MTLKDFFKTFELFADAPNAVEKMRELIFGMAIRGQLVKSDLRDEKVDRLLAANDETRRIIAKTDRRADADNLSLLSAEERWEIKDTWSWRALGDLALFVDYRGKTPTKLSKGVRLLTAKNVRKGEINLTPEEFLSEQDYQSWMTRGFPKPGDVLFTTEAPMGNAAVVRLEERFALAQRVICFQSYGAIDGPFLVLHLLSEPFQFLLEKNGTGVTAKGIKASKLKRLPVAVPPLAEQKRIVAKVDELMALCDQLATQQQEREKKHAALARACLARFTEAPTPFNLNLLFHKSYTIDPSDLRKSILTLAVHGKLVSQDSRDEPSEKLLQNIESYREEFGGYRKKDLPALSQADGPHEIPKPWLWCRINNLAVLMDYGTSEKADNNSTNIPVYRMGNIFSGKLVDENFKYVKPTTEDLPKLFLKKNDILFNRTNSYELVGKSAVFAGQDDSATFASYLIRIRVPNSLIDARYVCIAMNAPYYRQTQIEPEIVQQCGQANFNGTKLSATLIPVPPLAEQRRIVAKVDELMALVDALEVQLTQSRRKVSRLMEAAIAELTK